MGDEIGRVKAPSGKEFRVERSQHGVVQVKEITGLLASWLYVGKASTDSEALRMADGYVRSR